MTDDATKIYERAKARLQYDFESILRRLQESKDEDVTHFVQKLLEWNTDRRSMRSQLAWEIFHKAISIEDELTFFGSLNSFVGNCLLDDSYFTIEWRKTDYLVTTEVFEGREIQNLELQWLPNGDFKTKLTTKDDPEGKPVVIWSQDDNGKQDPKLLIEAMEIAEQRAIQRLKDMEELEEERDELIDRIRNGE